MNNGYIARGTYILMADGGQKRIENIKTGDKILGIVINNDTIDIHAECDHPYHAEENYHPIEVADVISAKMDAVNIVYNYGGEYEALIKISRNQRFLECGGTFVTIDEIMEMKGSFIWINQFRPWNSTQMSYYELEIQPAEPETIYQLLTAEPCGYIANGAVVEGMVRK